jgi:hypothetical protein
MLHFFIFDVSIVAVGKSLLAYYAAKLERVISFQVLTEGNMSILTLKHEKPTYFRDLIESKPKGLVQGPPICAWRPG